MVEKMIDEIKLFSTYNIYRYVYYSVEQVIPTQECYNTIHFHDMMHFNMKLLTKLNMRLLTVPKQDNKTIHGVTNLIFPTFSMYCPSGLKKSPNILIRK